MSPYMRRAATFTVGLAIMLGAGSATAFAASTDAPVPDCPPGIPSGEPGVPPLPGEPDGVPGVPSEPGDLEPLPTLPVGPGDIPSGDGPGVPPLDCELPSPTEPAE
ncbi:hypothetical protein ACFOVU_15160 [Nocardiopsis sediminis]|uniref:Uncharacterized protein n=1 Tax=Nocardiopsis sediminis TaxID=1778267 RepID=A0ABV8FMA0_9ACTN